MMNNPGETLLPDFLMPAHQLCFLNHDILVELLRSGEESGIFFQKFQFKDESDKELFQDVQDVFSWLERSGRSEERVELLKRVVFPALLSDFLHFVYESLESSRKEKLAVAYALIRKPLQETLFLFEVIAAGPERFAASLIEDPLKLRVKNAGGIDGHAKRIAVVLDVIGESDRFDPEYLARLRYAKVEDGFDGICNHAMHLFTEHEAIRTEALNINFIFSGRDQHITQWYYLYSRLPYLLFYARRLVEHVCSTFAKTDPEYLANLERRVMAGTLLWAPKIEETYRHEVIDKFVRATAERLDHECNSVGCRPLENRDLVVMFNTGHIPK
jgi:hypothetical protein